MTRPEWHECLHHAKHVCAVWSMLYKYMCMVESLGWNILQKLCCVILMLCCVILKQWYFVLSEAYVNQT